MPVTNYYSMNGVIVGEKTAGSERIDYLPDALGNVTATLNQSGQIVNTYRYKPYGAQLAKTGVGADPAFQWVGQHGYKQTGKKWSDVYVRARHYDTGAGRWTTEDPIGYEDGYNLYRYADNRPILTVDPSGRLCPPGHRCDHPDKYGCNRRSTVNCDTHYQTDGNLRKVASIATFYSFFCVGISHARVALMLGGVFACLALKESSLNPCCRTGENRGLFMIDPSHWRHCAGSCADCDICDVDNWGCQVTAAINIMFSTCKKGKNLCDALGGYFGATRPSQGADQPGGFFDCLRRNFGYSKDDLKKAPCPRYTPCRCNTDYSGAKYRCK